MIQLLIHCRTKSKCTALLLHWFHRCHLQHCWTYEGLKRCIAQQIHITGKRESPHIILLHRLFDSHEKLNAGLDLIPILLQFCSKLKKHLDFKCHEEEASTMTLKAAVEKACSEMKSVEEKILLRKTLQSKFIGECRSRCGYMQNNDMLTSYDCPSVHYALLSVCLSL